MKWWALLLFGALPVIHADGCHGRFVNPITDVCWDCLFPMTIGNNTVFSGDAPDTPNPGNIVCACPMQPVGVRLGIATGFWEPIAMTDVTRHRFCMVNLGGLQLANDNPAAGGEIDASDPSQGGSFYYVHWYKFPLLYWLNLLSDAMCVEMGKFDIAYVTEIDPTWHDDELTFLLNPEAALFANPTLQAICAIDSLDLAAGKYAVDSLFWCIGNHGSMYPLNGNVQEHVGGVRSSALLSERMAFKMHREGLLWDSVGANAPALCYQYPTPIMPKSRYRYQMVNPKPTADRCYPFGHTTSFWEAGHEYPGDGEDFGYLIWRKRNCCAL